MNVFFSGPGGSGKTFAQKYLINKYNYTPGKLALPLYAGAEFYGLMEKNKKDRKVLQTMGDIGRNRISKDIYINRFLEDSYIIQQTYKELHNKEIKLVLDDVRYENEVRALQEAGWAGIYLDCPAEIRYQRLYGRDGDAQISTLTHVSETEMESFKDQLIKVDSGCDLERMYSNLDEALEHIRRT